MDTGMIIRTEIDDGDGYKDTSARTTYAHQVLYTSKPRGGYPYVSVPGAKEGKGDHLRAADL